VRALEFFGGLSRRWQAWAAVIGVSAGLLGGALYFQEVERDYPCELCIYTRVWIVAIALVAVAGLALRKTVWPLRLIVAAELLLSVGLATAVWDLLGLEYGFGAPGACGRYPDFWPWAPLDQWLPVLFEVQGPCMATPTVLFGLSMADGLAVITSLFIASFALALAAEPLSRRYSVS
jgi:disulfide bond formation protein DsbB